MSDVDTANVLTLARARHSYGTNLLRGGNNIRVVQELMRHASLATTAGYLLVDEDERTAAINGLPTWRS